MRGLTTGQKFAIGAGFFVLVLLVIAIIYGLAGFIFACAWNFLMPSLWHAAPHFSWKMGVAAAWILGIIQSALGGGIKFNKKDFE